MNQSDEPLEGEDETDVLLRQYGLGRDEEDVIERYENALAAFDDEEKQVRFWLAIDEVFIRFIAMIQRFLQYYILTHPFISKRSIYRRKSTLQSLVDPTSARVLC